MKLFLIIMKLSAIVSVGLSAISASYALASNSQEQAGVLLAVHDGGRGGPPPGKGPSSGSDHHDDHDEAHDSGADDDSHDDEGHDEGEGKRGPRYKGGRGVSDLKSGFGHRFDSEAVIFRH